MLISLDLATTAGIAWLPNNSRDLFVTEVKGTAEDQYLYIQNLFNPRLTIVLIEEFVYFARSTKTQASLLKRIGVMEYLLGKTPNVAVESMHLQTVRAKYFKGKDKKKKCLEHFRSIYDPKLTYNHTDALLMLLYYLPLPSLDDDIMNEFTLRIV
jgi:hypothetical protein